MSFPLAGLLPDPGVLRAPLSFVPQPLLRFAMQRAIDLGFAPSRPQETLAALVGRRLGIDVTDLGLSWVVAVGPRGLEVLSPPAQAEATVRGDLTDLMLLASRQEDADTLFFHRRLQLTGDVELGLMVRNLLDQQPWESVPAPLRGLLEAGARLARDVRDARTGPAVRAG